MIRKHRENALSLVFTSDASISASTHANITAHISPRKRPRRKHKLNTSASKSTRIKNFSFSCAYACACVRVIRVKTNRRTSTRKSTTFVLHLAMSGQLCHSLQFPHVWALQQSGGDRPCELWWKVFRGCSQLSSLVWQGVNLVVLNKCLLGPFKLYCMSPSECG